MLHVPWEENYRQGFPQAITFQVSALARKVGCEYRILINSLDSGWEQSLQVSECGPEELAGRPLKGGMTLGGVLAVAANRLVNGPGRQQRGPAKVLAIVPV